MIGVSHEIQNHNVALEGIIIMIGVQLGEKSNEKAVSDFYGMYNPRKFCDWIAHLDYYFDLYEFSYARRVQFDKEN